MIQEFVAFRIEAACRFAARKLATLTNPVPDFKHVWETARDLDPDAFGEKPWEVKAADKEYLQELKDWRAESEPNPYDRLSEIAKAIELSEVVDRKEAFIRACMRNPDLYQEWREMQNAALAVPNLNPA